MSLRNLPELQAFALSGPMNWQMRNDALNRWDIALAARNAQSDAVIEILDVIGADFWTGGGITSESVRDQLRAIGDGPVTVNINSPGGDFFEGVAIYNLLRSHPGRVTVRVVGVAASAASIIAMAADELLMAKASFLMIHNVWVCACGNQHDLREVSETLAVFDQALAEVYADRSGNDVAEVHDWLKAEKWIAASEAKEMGFADGFIEESELTVQNLSDDKKRARAEISIDSALRAQLPKSTRAERRALLNECKGGKSGAAPETRDDQAFANEVAKLIETLKG